MFTHLLVRSAYSLLYGTRRIEDLVAAAAGMGYGAMALTDRDNLYGVHRFLAACRARGIRPLIGAEVAEDGAEKKAPRRAVLLARNRAGFENLSLLLTERKRMEGFDLAARLPWHEEGNFVFTDSPELLEAWAGRVKDLYALLTPSSRGAAGTAVRLGLPAVASGEAVFLESEDEKLHRVLRAVAKKGTVSLLESADSAPSGSLLFPPGRADEVFRDFPDALANNRRIADACRFDAIFQGFVFPKCPDRILQGRPSEEVLRERVYRGAEERYGELGEGVVERIDYELEIIARKGFTDYFLVVSDIVSLTSRTCGRGSGAASVVAYCLGITNVDPIRYNLYFERFLNPRRKDPPDIDIDFAWDERDAVIEEVMRRYGEDRSARIANHNHFRRRGALREVARVYGIPDAETSAFEKRLSRGEAEPDEVWKEIQGLADRMTGLPRNLGVHSGGLVLTPKPIASYVPVETAAMGVPVVTWEKDGVEEAGLVKIDLLGNRSLAVIRDALANLRRNGAAFDESEWSPQDDEAARVLLARGDSMGVFYIESPAMRQLQKKTGRGDFEHIVIHSSIIRPAANKYINEYVRRLRGEPYEPLLPELDRVLAETHGIMVYQEDVSKAAIVVADFTDADADGLRKIMSKKDKEAKLAEYRKMFFDGAAGNEVPQGTAEKIWNMILSFDGYSFCKPHSASYAVVSFQSAYLKAHHPAEFMAAVLSNQGGFYTAGAYVSEAKRMGLAVRRPDVNASSFRWDGRGREIRAGLMAIAGLRRETADLVVSERERGGPYRGLADFAVRVPLRGEDAEALVSAGALDSVADVRNRPEQLMTLLMQGRGPAPGGQGELFAPAEARPRRLKDLREDEKLRKEWRRLGFLADGHPLRFWRERIDSLPHVAARDLAANAGRRIVMIGWLVTVKEIVTIEGKPMEFVSFEDETAIFETVFFPESYKRFAPLLDDRVPFVLRGLADDDLGAVSLHVEELEALD